MRLTSLEFILGEDRVNRFLNSVDVTLMKAVRATEAARGPIPALKEMAIARAKNLCPTLYSRKKRLLRRVWKAKAKRNWTMQRHWSKGSRRATGQRQAASFDW